MTGLEGKTLCIYLPDLADNGVTRLYLGLIPHFAAAGLDVTLLLDHIDAAASPGRARPEAKLHVFGRRGLAQTFPALIGYLGRAQPDIILTAHKHKSIVVNWAKPLSRADVRHIAVLHMPLDPPVQVDASLANRVLPVLMRRFLRYADHVVSVSRDMAQALQGRHGLDTITVITNGVVGPEFDRLAAEPVHHPWLQPDAPRPVFVTAGRLNVQKDHKTLLEAFALYRQRHSGRLIIFGEGEERRALTALAARLGIAADLDMPGHTPNILPSLRQASAFILSSAFEVLPLVIIEALACGAPVISSNCDFGPAELLDHGRYGQLFRVGDARELAALMGDCVQSPSVCADLVAYGHHFTLEDCANKYIQLFARQIYAQGNSS
jgi:glycosyltransferase involved in cell wall biosynthesis